MKSVFVGTILGIGMLAMADEAQYEQRRIPAGGREGWVTVRTEQPAATTRPYSLTGEREDQTAAKERILVQEQVWVGPRFMGVRSIWADAE